ncbi:uncharacterized protein LOC133428310 isoform X2 [Cololabis saira]|uniref:uncharacterized protein LOC133428310 isoform X2 n=1 Tax=Cololabis saira TaxID=129043 RepID=UPI002AD1D065|nr:uncharacterized protein LOC133428310 isoform X2 [Cololabis saira]
MQFNLSFIFYMCHNRHHRMCGFHQYLLRFCVLGYVFCKSDASWQVKLPSHIEGLLGSCLVIPCSFDYYRYPPKRPDRVVWYQYVSNGYPLVYDNWYPGNVIPIFRRRTYAFTSRYGRTCSLQVSPVSLAHHKQKIYPWVDPENVGRSTYRFFDTTVTIQVMDRAKKPNIMITGDMRVGKPVTVQCSVDHTCRTNPPLLSLNIPLNSHDLTHTESGYGTRTTLTTTLLIQRDHQTVECSVRHPGGLTAKAYMVLNAQCSFSPLTISPTVNEFLEGLASKVSCTATYTCSNHIPTLTWNYGGMSTSTDTSALGPTLWKTVSTLMVTPSASDHGRSLTCTAHFTGGQTQQRSITLQVKRNMHTLGWTFSTPRSVTGLTGSCVVIPCKFTYSNSQPGGLQVIWYLYETNGYRAVFNERERNLIGKFNGRTSLIGSVADSNCSLKIERLEKSHNQDRLYPWIDRNPITSYHTHGFSFNDKTTQIFVLENAEEPQLSIIGIPRVGEQSTVSCSARHTCPPAPPVLTLNGIPGSDHIRESLVSDGIWERTIERTWVVQEEHKKVECTVSYPSGQRATKELLLNVECPHDDIKMTEPPRPTTEGVATSVICSVTYKCSNNKPTIEWNYEVMQSSTKTKTISHNTYSTQSNLTFIGSLGDDGKSLTCTADFKTGKTSDSAVLQIIKYEKPVEPSENETLHVLAADVPFRFNALTHSCVVIPCSFQDKEDIPMTRGIWSKKKGGIIFHNSRSRITDHFKDRTRILGDLNSGDCSLEIDDIKPFDNGPFCFHAEKNDNEYRFNNSCVFVVMKVSPEKPVMTRVPTEVDAGSTVTVSCSVNHTCSSHPPEFSWSVPDITSQVSDTLMSQGVWQRTSTITFMVPGGDGDRILTCTAIFWREKKQASTVTLVVKGTMMFQLRSSVPVVVPVSLLVLLLIIVASVSGVFIHRKRKRTDELLTLPPRPEKRRSLWDRISRYPEAAREKPPRPEKRRSIWSRFSRRTEEDRVGWQNMRKSFWSRFSRHQENTANLSVSYLNHTNTVISNAFVPKQPFPSPKNKQRRPPPATPEDCQVYGNI